MPYIMGKDQPHNQEDDRLSTTRLIKLMWIHCDEWLNLETLVFTLLTLWLMIDFSVSLSHQYSTQFLFSPFSFDMPTTV